MMARPDVPACMPAVFGTDLASLRLRVEAVVRLYGDPFGPSDVARLTDDIVSSADEVDVGVLSNLHSRLPLGRSSCNSRCDPDTGIQSSSVGHRGVREVAAFFHRVLLRVLKAPDPIGSCASACVVIEASGVRRTLCELEPRRVEASLGRASRASSGDACAFS